MSGINITFSENVTPLLKRLETLAHDLTPAMQAGADALAARVKDQLTKLPVPWAQDGGAAPEVKASFTAQSALVTVAAPAPPISFTAADAQPALAIVADAVRRAVGGA